MTDIHIPKLGMSTVEVDIVAVLVRVGDHVEPETPVVEVESEKVTTIVEASVTGVVAEVLVAEGDVRNVGDVVARVQV
jgi:pyruvate/2-oxoglutarate dehydrogenase complex dihydrolipoamide acyltransferase (E2) component